MLPPVNTAICLATNDRFQWRHWDGELVFYDRLSGETRVIDGISGWILEVLTDLGPVNLDRLERELAASTDIPIDAEFRNVVHNGVATLHACGVLDYTGNELSIAP